VSGAPQPRWLIIFVTIVIIFTGGVVFADWEPGDPALFYQLPSATGWDVYSEWGTGPLSDEGYGAANDWHANVTAPITDIHFWGSWKNDVAGNTGRILIQIFDNDTSNPAFARPDDLLWSRVINPGQGEGTYVVNPWSSSPTNNQGWYDPRYTDHWQSNEHGDIYQYNIPNIANPFIQQAGHTYWLEISVDFEGCVWGWKTTDSVQGNPSVFWDSYETWGPHDKWHRHPEIDWKWTKLSTPSGYCDPRQSMDVAFVLTTPEPATLFLLAAGAVVVLRRRRK
jgi:hypothetical protein